jgi:hypothetical protein|tara:strand:+ start:911 stop:2230 length:1320 start_codon:yes stop_codon:yes gene_type:complete
VADILKRAEELSDLFDNKGSERLEFSKGTRVGFRNPGAVVSEDMRAKSAEAIKSKASKKLKNFVETFKLENDGKLPTQQQIMKSVGGKSATVQKYLKEGVDYVPRLSKIEAGRLAGIRSGEVRAVPEGQDPSYVKRAKTLDEAKKFLSKQDKADFKAINDGKKAINKFFQKNPKLINTTEFGKNIKAMMSLRMDKETGNIFSKLRPDDYYIKRAKEGKLFDIFDIKPVKEGGRSLRFPTNINLTPGQFNQVFIQNQAGKLFAKGVNKDALKNLNKLLVDQNIRVQLPNVGMIGAKPQVAATGTQSRTFPAIVETLKKMKAPENILKNFIDIAPLPGPFKALKKFEEGGRVNFSEGKLAGILRSLKPFSSKNKYTNQLEGILYGQEGLSEILSLLSSAGLFAGGGIAKQAGIDSGPPPISGPTPDGDEGLPAAFKRGIKT